MKGKKQKVQRETWWERKKRKNNKRMKEKEIVKEKENQNKWKGMRKNRVRWQEEGGRKERKKKGCRGAWRFRERGEECGGGTDERRRMFKESEWAAHGSFFLFIARLSGNSSLLDEREREGERGRERERGRETEREREALTQAVLRLDNPLH